MSTPAGGRVRVPGRRAVRPAGSLRDRILASATQLFYAQGIRAVSVDAIAAGAGTNKMTLYRHFTSKDALVEEYLRALAEDTDDVWAGIQDTRRGDSKGQLLAMIRVLAGRGTHGAGRGCALANAAVELTGSDHPGLKIVEAHKRQLRGRLVQLCRAAGIIHAGRVADQVFLLMEGAQISMQSVGAHGPGSRLLSLAEDLIALHLERDAGRRAGDVTRTRRRGRSRPTARRGVA